ADTAPVLAGAPHISGLLLTGKPGNLRAMQLQALAPSMQQDDLAIAVLVAKHAPHREAAGIILLLLGIGWIKRGDDEFEHREFAIRSIPDFPILTLENATTANFRGLLKLAGDSVGTEHTFQLRDSLGAETRLPGQFTINSPRIAPADHRPAMPGAVILHRDHDMDITEVSL